VDIQILGAHNCESQNSRLVSLLIDDILAVDAGCLTSTLSFPAQQKLKAILISHQHYDHIRDILTIAMNLGLQSATIDVYSTNSVCEVLTNYLLDGRLYPRFLKLPEEKPTLRLMGIEMLKPATIAGYSVLAVPVPHSDATVGYQITSPGGKSVFYSADTGPGLINCWGYISPQLLIIEVTMPDRYRELAIKSEHLTPSLLKQELTSFREIKGYLPSVVVVHMNPRLEEEIEAEIDDVAKGLGSSITIGYEGMQLYL